MLVSGADGRPLARFATPLPDGAVFHQTGVPAEHAEINTFHLIGQVGNLFGQGQPDLMLHSNPGGVIWVYRNPAVARGTLPPGLRPNVTLY